MQKLFCCCVGWSLEVVTEELSDFACHVQATGLSETKQTEEAQARIRTQEFVRETVKGVKTFRVSSLSSAAEQRRLFAMHFV